MGKRIEYIDAMRGLAMLFVVIGHVFFFSFRHTENVIYLILSNEIQIPLFFMVSGFLMKAPKCNYWSFYKGKVFSLLVPATIFMTIYVWLNNYSYIASWGDNFKYGYWFTFSLFEFVLIYTTYKIISRKMRLNLNVDNILLVIITIVITFTFTLLAHMNKDSYIMPLFCLTQFKSFPYFILGTILAERDLIGSKWNTISKWGSLIILLCFIFHIYIYKDIDNIFLFQYKLLLIPTTILGLLVLLLCFKNYESWSSSWIGKNLQTVGRYTLNIYFIHYFFLPRNLSVMGDWFIIHPNPLVEYVIAIIIAVVLIIASILMGHIIRLSPVMAHYLLGEKYHKK